MNKLCTFFIPAILLGFAIPVQAQTATSPGALVVTATNTTTNQLLVFTTAGKLLQTLNTGGKGGVSGNAGGLATYGMLVAVVNFGSETISVFERGGSGLKMIESFSTAAAPVSLAFSASHLYILETTKVESHRLSGNHVTSTPDGVAGLLAADGSAAQVGVLGNQLIITEKSGFIETVGLSSAGAVIGPATSVKNIPPNPMAPFGLITRGDDAYVTIAHSNEITLVRNDTVLTVSGSGTQNAPCWLALDGPFLFSSNSPSMTVSRYAVYGQKIVQDQAVAAVFNGNPTDIAYAGGYLAVVDSNNNVGHLSIYTVDEDGNPTYTTPAITINPAANGVLILPLGTASF
jgi:hypothetical protein